MTIQQVMIKLQEEQQQRLPGRYHCRAIMVRNIAQYIYLLNELKKLNDVNVISVDELFSGADVMPSYEILAGKEYQDKWIILPGVSEYLRLFHNSEESAQRFGELWRHQSDASTTGRILIPLWGCETLWYDKALRLCDDIRQKEYFYDCSDTVVNSQQMKIQVLSEEFEQYLPQLETNTGAVFFGLREWYAFWSDPQENMVDHLIVTKRFRSVKSTDGDIQVHVVKDTLSFIKENLAGGSALNANNCPKEAQQCLFTSALSGKSVNAAVLSALNANEFRPLDIMGKWNTMSEGQQQLVFLWYGLHPDDTYLCHCVNLASSPNDLLKQISIAVFPARAAHKDWVQESQALMAAIPVSRNDDYYNCLDEIPSREERLDYLTTETARERVYILHLVGQWLRDDSESVFQSKKLKDIYPALFAYLKAEYPDEELNHYFDRYKTYKLSNTLPQDLEIYFSGVDTDSYDFRYPVLDNEANDQTLVLWIDALGIEWMPLLNWALQTSCDGDITSVKVTQAQLPSETCFNEQWNSMSLPYQKYDKLDKLAHKGVIDDKDYYACVEEQLRFVGDVVEKVNKLLKQHSRIIITGDHGTSRLAARFFHKLDGFPAPAHSEVGSHGRFCRITTELMPAMDTQKIAKDNQGNKYIIFANYDHFKQSGFAAGADDDTPIFGEIHGGASPEEMLVPVFTINSKYELPITVKWLMPGNSTKVSNKRVKCQLQFSRPVTTLQAKMESIEAECSAPAIPSKDWTIVFNGVKFNNTKMVNISLLADGILISAEAVTIKPPLGGGDPF